MPTLSDLRRPDWRRWVVMAICLILGVPLGMFALNVYRTFTGAYDGIPQELLASGDMGQIRGFQERLREASESAPLLFDESADEIGEHLPDAPDHVRRAGSTWVQAVNHYNPDAIMYHDVDSFGNLYLVLGGWWLELSDRDHMRALDSLGRYWRSYLYDLYGAWDTGRRGTFAPGVVLVDPEGNLFARNLNGTVEILQDPIYP